MSAFCMLQSKLNCEVLYDELAFEVRWAVAGDSIVLQLVAKLEDGEYMSFGISGDPSHSQMVGGDVAVAWVDKTTLKGVSKDYYLDAKSQCAGVRGSCPDDRLVDGTDSIRLLNAALVNGYSIVTYQRSLKAADELDLPVLTNASQPVIWAVGPLNSRTEVSYHHHFTKGDKFIEFGRPPVWNCPMPEGEEEHHSGEDAPAASAHHERKPVEDKSSPINPNPVPPPKSAPKAEPWDIPAIQCYEPQDGVYYAQMGPTGGKQGYPAITGHVGWGISWYINGLLIPEVNVVRGRKYTFVVEGGNDPSQPARYHPFYITDDPVGGYFHKSEQEKQDVKIFAGVRRARSGELVPTGVGRLCNWTPDKNGPEADEYPSFGAYQRSLTLVCEEGSPGVVTWIPDKNTPDTVYYQCFTHRHLGWKINVVDECDAAAGEESRVAEQLVIPDLHIEESIQVHSRLSPDNNFLEHKRFEKIINTKPHYNDFSSDKAKPGSALYMTEYESPISSGQIKDVIDVVETLESSMKEQMRRNTTYPQHQQQQQQHQQHQHQQFQQYQVTEDVRELLPEQAGDEYEVAARPNTYSLPPSQQPLTLQSVLRPNRPSGMRPPFRRPTPPEIKLRRPPPMHQKGNGGYPLPMPSQNNHGPKKHNVKYPNSRPQNRPPMSGIPLGKPLPQMHHHKPNFNQGPPKQIPKIPSGPVQSIIMGKPAPVNLSPPTQSQTLSLGKTDIIASHVVKSQITLPGGGDVIVAQHSAPQISIARPGQIILGKPMEHPVPLDQQMTPTKQLLTKTYPTPAPEYHSSTQRLRVKPDNSHQNDMKSSDFIGESVENTPLHPAVNTGFKPDTIVVESGFKPIIREPLMAGEDRITDYDGANRREDTDVEEDYDEAPQTLSNHAYSSDKLTQSFEPMFIPSPPDRHLPSDDRTKEIFPSNHAKEDRPHPVYVKTETELNALFSKKNMEKEVPDMVMESDRVSPQYLPPDPKFPKEHSQKLSNEQTYTAYDGKTVSASTLVTVPAVQQPEPHNSKPFSSKVSSNSEFLLKTPQFGPFKGEIPTEVAEQLKTGEPKQQKNPTTHLKLVNAFVEPQKETVQDLKAEGSEVDEAVSIILTPIDDSDYDDDEESMENEEIRKKRETKATQFERGEVEPQPPTSGISLTKNQVEFDVKKNTNGNAATTLQATSLVLLIVSLLRLL
ncbi:hypothetical protein MSG28_014034 [Choristoneura fumiferana]|uniref:Uncharacterized protein n=1 Tax=Choristoneura fumiferana TaxID=7141 RepID=A0ACC0JFK5_CHOFU|nr:hypothetical protein MSG28_014034 [Choristoneura fumiferana]